MDILEDMFLLGLETSLRIATRIGYVTVAVSRKRREQTLLQVLAGREQEL